jgi:hypothetical protein
MSVLSQMVLITPLMQALPTQATVVPLVDFHAEITEDRHQVAIPEEVLTPVPIAIATDFVIQIPTRTLIMSDPVGAMAPFVASMEVTYGQIVMTIFAHRTIVSKADVPLMVDPLIVATITVLQHEDTYPTSLKDMSLTIRLPLIFNNNNNPVLPNECRVMVNTSLGDLLQLHRLHPIQLCIFRVNWMSVPSPPVALSQWITCFFQSFIALARSFLTHAYFSTLIVHMT